MARTLFAVIAVAVFGSLSALPDAAEHGSVLYRGHSGVWYDPDRSGEGYVLEIISESAATLTWFTYDGEGRQRWLAGVGRVVRDDEQGTFLVFDELYETSGGVFGDEFDPSRVVRTVVASARLEFDGCHGGRLSYDAYGIEDAVEVQRLGITMGTDCAPVHGKPAGRLEPYAGQSGSWFDPTHNGEGFQLQWTSADQALLTWYSYDAAGRQYWMTGAGTRDEDGAIQFPSLVATRGARFGPEFDPSDVERFHWGSLTLDLDCEQGSAVYSSDMPGFAPGAQALRKITGLLGVSCPWAPQSLTDLYELELAQVPTVLPSDGLPISVQVFSIADDGTLIGATGRDGVYQLYRLGAGEAVWVALTDLNLAGIPFVISADGSRILVNEKHERLSEFAPLLLSSGQEPSRLSDRIFVESISLSGSMNLTHVVGIGRPSESVITFPWIWSEGNGQVELPRPAMEGVGDPRPLGVSEQGDIVVGFGIELTTEGFPFGSALRWKDGELPEPIYDSTGARLGPAVACSADCRTVFGTGQAENDPEHPFRNQPWVEIDLSEVMYLGHTPDALSELSGSPYQIRDASRDGSLAVGDYVVARQGNVLGTEPLLWTRFTGMVPLRELATLLDGTTQTWEDLYVMGVSSDGSLILLHGLDASGGANPTIFRSAVLRLRPRMVGEAHSNPR